jgi:hypothetical protein
MIKLFLFTALTLLPFNAIMADGSPQKTKAQTLLEEIETVFDSMHKKNTVFSPAMIREKLQLIIAKEKQANAIIATLSNGEKSELITEQLRISQVYKPAMKLMAEITINADYKQNESIILQKAAPVITTALAGAGTGVVLEVAKNGINSLTSVDTSNVMNRATENALIAIIQTSTEKYIGATHATFVSGTGARALTTMLNTGQLPTAMDSITAGIVNEAFTVAMQVVENSGGIAGIVNKIDWRKLAIREKNSMAIMAVTDAATPVMQTLMKNQTVATTFVQIGGKALQGGVVGGVFRLFLASAGIIPADDIIADISAGVIEGTITGLIAATGTEFTGREGGIITTSSHALTTIASSVARGAGIAISPHNALQGIGQAAVQTIIPALVDKKLLFTVTKNTTDVLKSRWLPTWNGLSNMVNKITGTISDFVQTVQSMEPLPI